MRRLKLLGLLVAALLVTGSTLAGTALGAEQPENLPTLKAGESRNWTGKSEGATELKFSSITMSCASAESTGTETASKSPSGAFHLDFKECTTEGLKCTGESDTTAGLILMLGTWSLVFDRKKTEAFKELTTALLLKIEPAHFKCTALVLIEFKGEQICLDLKPSEENRTHSIHCIANGTTQTEEWCMKDISEKCEEPLVPVLLASDNHMAFTEAAMLGLGNMTFNVSLTGMI